jgi:ABC-type uncharacterized transport system substrate-binding protein
MERRAFLKLSLASVATSGAALGQGPQPKRPKRIIIVQSQEKGHVCGEPQAEGILAALATAGWREGVNLTVRFHYMDYYGRNATPEALRSDGQSVLRQIEEFAPDLVFTLDDGAISEVMMPLVGRSDLPIVFSGMNAQPDDYNLRKRFMNGWNRPGGNVTGMYEKLYAAESLRVMAEAVKGLSGAKVVMITDLTVTGNALTNQFERELKSVDHVRWEVRRTSRWDDYAALIRDLNADDEVKAIYPLALSMVDSNGQRITAPRIYDWTLSHSRKPEMAVNYFFARMGLFGGAVINFGAMGLHAGRKGAAILNGARSGDLPIEESPDYAIVFNQKRARDLGIAIPPRLLAAAHAVYVDDLIPLQGKSLIYDPKLKSF